MTDDHKEAGISRSMVQKSVVVLLKKPLYGAVLLTLDAITVSYFEQGLIFSEFYFGVAELRIFQSFEV